MLTDDFADRHAHLTQVLDLEALRTLCATLEIDYDDLRGEGKSAKVRELLIRLKREQRLEQLFPTLLDKSSTQSDLEKRYVAYLQRRYSHIPLGGIAPRIQDRVLNLSVQDLFVPPQAEQDAPLRTQFISRDGRQLLVKETAGANLKNLEEIFSEQHVVILGEPGAGKSTLLRWLINHVLKAPSVLNELPVFVRLVHFAAALEHTPELTLATYLRQHYLPEYPFLFISILRYGRGWLLLDGLDEVAKPYQRRQVRDAVETFVAQFPDFHVVITSRVAGYRAAPLAMGFQHFTLQPFNRESIRQFLQNWYHAVYRQTGEMVTESLLQQRANHLLEGLESKPSLWQLAGTPLLLAIIALMDWKDKEIPQRRVELYEAATQTLLEDWPSAAGRPQANLLSLADQLSLLAPLAFEMFATGFNEAIRYEQLQTKLTQLLQQLHTYPTAEAHAWIQAWLPILSEQSGLLIEAGIDEYSRPIYAFLHLSFVEYLSGRALAMRWQQESVDLTPYVNDPRWREVVLLMVGHIGMASTKVASRLVEEICSLTPPHHDLLHQNLVLAAACLADDVRVTAVTRTKIIDQLIPLWHQNTSGLIRSKLFRILAAMRGTDSAAQLIEQLMPLVDAKETWVRSSILELLSKLASPYQPIPKDCFLKALQDLQPQVQQAAVRAIETLELAHDPEVRLRLQQIFPHAQAKVRTRIVLALGIVANHDDQINAFIRHLLTQDENENVRQMSMRVLGTAQHPPVTTVATALSALSDTNIGVRKEAAAALVHWENGRQPLAANLQQALQDPDKQKRRHTLEIIADIGSVLGSDAVDLLLEMAEKDQDLWVRGRAIRALGQLSVADERVVAALVNALPSQNRVARQGAALGLKRLGICNAYVSTALATALQHPDTQFRRYAADALQRCGQPSAATIKALETALSDSNELVQLSSAIALTKLGANTSFAYGKLAALIQSENIEVRRRAVQGLRGFLHRLHPHLIEIMTTLATDDDQNVQEEVLLNLAELGHQASANVIVACRHALNDKVHWIRMRAAEALGKLGASDQATIAALLKALTDKHERVRLAASNALIDLGAGSARESIIHQVRTLLVEQPQLEDILNTLWGLVVGE